MGSKLKLQRMDKPSSTMQCTRCGVAGHSAVDCTTKSFMRPLCSQCNRCGHVKADCPQLRRCNHCGGLGHIARDCPKESKAEVSETSKSQEKQKDTRKCQGADDDKASVHSNSTAATRADLEAKPVEKCSFCGTARVPSKYKPGVKDCKDRCKSCFRKF